MFDILVCIRDVGEHPSVFLFGRKKEQLWSDDETQTSRWKTVVLFQQDGYLFPKSCRSRRTHTSPVEASWSRRRRVTAPLFSNSFLMVATGTSVRPRMAGVRERKGHFHMGLKKKEATTNNNDKRQVNDLRITAGVRDYQLRKS